MKLTPQKGKKQLMWTFITISIIVFVIIALFLNQPNFGRIPSGERLIRIKESPNYGDGKFQNLSETPQLTNDKSFGELLFNFIFQNKDCLRPAKEIPHIKTDLWNLDKKQDALIWFGHSSYLLQIDEKRILVDPVLTGAASPVSFINKPFKGTNSYKPMDMPEIDYLLITHDHWDHLDYKTVMQLKDRIGKVICGLGVGEHFEHWGYDKSHIIELDWNEEVVLDNGFKFYCLPARHFSGRGLKSNQSLWVSFLLQTPSLTVYMGGDSGYDSHFTDIGKRFPNIDLAILENGQYNEDWKYIHTLPQYLAQAFNDLGAKKLFTVHHSKYALANHVWDEPLKNITCVAQKDSIPLIQPLIGEVVNLNDSAYTLVKWWENH
ncbi:MAG: MBL fold metallo-hydrolase [Bacteroidales bacterium]|nr:MBL fold metallo-hydrolase [Bacteroidales bacterium]